MKVFLIGLPGSGKTTLGKHLADRLAVPFVDLDAAIEKQEGKSVQEIFARETESYFRAVEARALNSFCQEKMDFVMATGGGTPGFFDNMALMNRSGKTLFLDASTSEICSRLQRTDLSARPLFSNLNSEQLKNKIDELRSQRIGFYQQAKVIIYTDASLDQILDRLRD